MTAALAVLLSLLAAPAAPEPGQGARAPAPDSLVGAIVSVPPESALQALACAYAEGSVPALDALFTRDFTFLSPGERPEPRLPEPSGRAAELAAAAEMFRAPSSDSVVLHLGTVVQGVDPAHADSTRHYRVLAAQRLSYDVHLGGGRVLRARPTLHAFHVVRGDAALLLPGQPADSTRWYLRLWFEDADRLAAALAAVRGDCALEQQQAPEPEPPAPPPDTAGAAFERSWVEPGLVAPDSALAADSTVAADDSLLAAADSSMALAGSERVPGEDEDLAAPAGADEEPQALADSLAAAPPAPRVLAVEPLGRPSCAKLDVRCDLPRGEPARLEVYDVTGRRLQRVEMGIRAPAELRVRAGAGVALVPGAYWLRLTQGGRSVTRLVAVAR